MDQPEPPTAIKIAGQIFDLLAITPLERARLCQQLKLANASYAYWIYRERSEQRPGGDAA